MAALSRRHFELTQYGKWADLLLADSKLFGHRVFVTAHP